MSGGSCKDLSEYQDVSAVQDAFSALVSGGRPGYKTVIERKKDLPKCLNCEKILKGEEKFCPECGTKTNFEQ